MKVMGIKRGVLLIYCYLYIDDNKLLPNIAI